MSQKTKNTKEEAPKKREPVPLFSSLDVKKILVANPVKKEKELVTRAQIKYEGPLYKGSDKVVFRVTNIRIAGKVASEMKIKEKDKETGKEVEKIVKKLGLYLPLGDKDIDSSPDKENYSNVYNFVKNMEQQIQDQCADNHLKWREANRNKIQVDSHLGDSKIDDQGQRRKPSLQNVKIGWDQKTGKVWPRVRIQRYTKDLPEDFELEDEPKEYTYENINNFLRSGTKIKELILSVSQVYRTTSMGYDMTVEAIKYIPSVSINYEDGFDDSDDEDNGEGSDNKGTGSGLKMPEIKVTDDDIEKQANKGKSNDKKEVKESKEEVKEEDEPKKETKKSGKKK
jgi:hypothetical protein